MKTIVITGTYRSSEIHTHTMKPRSFKIDDSLEDTVSWYIEPLHDKPVNTDYVYQHMEDIENFYRNHVFQFRIDVIEEDA